MDKFTTFLKKKGPLGMPMAFWAGFAAVTLYLGYRWYKNRSGSSSSNSNADTGTTDSTGADTTGGAVPSGIDQSVPPDSTVPGADEVNPPTSTGPGTTTTTDPTTGRKKKPKPKHHPATPHDHRQGSSHTNKRRLPVRKSRSHHAPVNDKRPHSNEKRRMTQNVQKAADPTFSSGARRGVVAAPVSPKKVAKTLPAPPHHESPSEKVATTPLQKRRRG